MAEEQKTEEVIKEHWLLMPDDNSAVLDESSGLVYIYAKPRQLDFEIEHEFLLSKLREIDKKGDK